MTPYVEHIRHYRASQQSFDESYEQEHYTYITDGRNTANHNLNCQAQVITCQCHICYYEIRELTLQRFAQYQVHSATPCQLSILGVDLPAVMSSLSYGKNEFMGPHNRHDGMHPDTIIKDVRA
jgi:hypothetical protein